MYCANLLKKLKLKVLRQVDLLDDPPLFDVERSQAATTINEFDDACTAPLFGYDGFIDYYNKTSSMHYIDGITVPTMALNSLDDPFFDCGTYPEESEDRPLKLVYTDKGGHLGFMFHEGQIRSNNGAESNDGVLWMPNELASFIDHVHVRTFGDDDRS